MAIKELKKHNATTRSNPPPKRAVNTHDTDPTPAQPPTDTPTGDPTPPDSPADPDLDNTEPCEAFTFDDSTLEHIMDTYSPSYSINKTHIYHVSKHSSSHYGSLIDRGANGGLAGSDVRILERTGRTVSVTGIDNHELPGLDIVTCVALLHTKHGKVVLIMHEYAYYGRGNTIHSPGQIEWFQNTCDDKSFHVGGKQVINFLDGYSTPLQCRTGLMYMSLLGKPTDADLNTYALTHKLLDDDTKKILYRSAVRPSDSAHPNKLSLSGLGKIIVNLLPNPWQNTTLMILLVEPSYSQRMNKEKGLGPP